MEYEELINSINTITSSVQSLAVGIGGKNEQKRAFDYNKQMMDKQFDQNSQLMDKSHQIWQQQTDYINEYNTPTNQIKRLTDAGLNPLFEYGNETSSVTPSPPSGSVGLGSYSPPSNAAQVANAQTEIIRAAIDQRKENIAINNLMADTKQKLSNVANIDQDTENAKVMHEQINQNINLLQAQTIEKYNNIRLSVESMYYDLWYKRQLVNIGSMNAETNQFAAVANAEFQDVQGTAAMMNATTAQGTLQLGREQLLHQVDMDQKRLANDTARLLKEFQNEDFSRAMTILSEITSTGFHAKWTNLESALPVVNALFQYVQTQQGTAGVASRLQANELLNRFVQELQIATELYQKNPDMFQFDEYDRPSYKAPWAP